MDGEYPKSLFLTVFFSNFLVKHIYLALPGLTLLIVGIWVKPCLYIGLAFLALDLILSLLGALQNRKVFLTSDNPNFREAQEAILSQNWRENMKKMVEQKQEDAQQRVTENAADLNDRFNRARYMDKDDE